GAEGAQTDGPAGWAEVLGGSGVQRSSGGVDGYDTHMRGIAVGADGRLPEGPLAFGLLLGAAIGRIESEAKGDDGSTDIDSHFAAVYGSGDLAGLRLSGQLLAAHDSYDSRRSVAVGALGASPSGSSHGWGLAGGAAVAREIRLGPALALTPTAGLRLGRTWRPAFDERDGGAANLAVAAAAQTSLRSRLGMQLDYARGPATAGLSLGWSHEFLDDGAESEARLAGGAFTVASAPPGRDSLDAGAAVGIALGEAVTLEAGYRLSATRSSTAHAGTASLRITW
ncbi:autotransporter outer membrane beta-barrel domain-containing protein, partial [Marinibaculum pumilum]